MAICLELIFMRGTLLFFLFYCTISLVPNAEFSGGRGLPKRFITDTPRPSAATPGVRPAWA
jgi:hypothetical protein